MRIGRWLSIGMGIKRWVALAFVGLVLLALAAAHVIRQATRDVEPSGIGATVLDVITLQPLPYPLRGLIIGLIGVALVAYGAARLVRAVTDPFVEDGSERPLVELIYQKRFLAKGPRIVAIGGGTGLSALLRGLKVHTSNLTAVVTVADDGGSSGVLRDAFGIPAVGDLRNCIAALADDGSRMSDLLQYRFPADQAGPAVDVPDGPSLAGHPMGNLLLAALTAIEGGDFEEGVRQMNRVLAVRGQVVPVSPTPIVLHAQLSDGQQMVGQSAIMRAEGIERVWISPADVQASVQAMEAIAAADLIVIGPGSLYTSLLPNLLVPGLSDALASATGLRIYVCNVATQLGETSGRDLADHVEALLGHAGSGIIDVVVANNQFGARIPEGWPAQPVQLRWPPALDDPPRLVLDDVVDASNAHRHDPDKLALALLRQAERELPMRRRSGVARTA